MWSYQISLFQCITGDALHDSIGGIESEYAIVKYYLEEFEEAFIATPEFASPLEKNVPATTAANMRVSSTLLACSRALVENNIKKIMQLVTETWETSQNIVSFWNKASDLLEHL